MGRVTLNPIRHLDPLGTIFILLVGFGWGRPVEFRPQALGSKQFGGALVALAGPLMNLVLAIAAGLLLSITATVSLPGVVVDFLALFAGINIALAVFNLIPLPPLDGSRLLTIFLPPKHQRIIYFLDRYGLIILLVLLLFAGNSLILPLICGATEIIGRVTGSGLTCGL